MSFYFWYNWWNSRTLPRPLVFPEKCGCCYKRIDLLMERRVSWILIWLNTKLFVVEGRWPPNGGIAQRRLLCTGMWVHFLCDKQIWHMSLMQASRNILAMSNLIHKNVLAVRGGQKCSFPRKKFTRCSWVLVVTELIVSGTQCSWWHCEMS